MEPWRAVLEGQPIIPAVVNELGDCIQRVFDHFEGFIFKLQTLANKDMRVANNKLCVNV